MFFNFFLLSATSYPYFFCKKNTFSPLHLKCSKERRSVTPAPVKFPIRNSCRIKLRYGTEEGAPPPPPELHSYFSGSSMIST